MPCDRLSRTRFIRSAIAIGSAALVLAAVLGGPVSAASGVVVTCGQTISVSTKVANDLINCPGSGLLIDTAGVVLDLAGHTIDGSDSGTSDGIVVDANDVVVKNGDVSEFGDDGVEINNVSGAIVSKVSSFENNGVGISIAGAGTRVLGFRGSHNTVAGLGADADDVVVERSRFNDNNGFGLFFEGGNNGVEVNKVTADGNGADGLLTDAETTITKVKAVGNDGDGIDINDAGSSIGSSKATFNSLFGIDAVAGVTDLGGNKAKVNGSGPPHCVNVSCS